MKWSIAGNIQSMLAGKKIFALSTVIFAGLLIFTEVHAESSGDSRMNSAPGEFSSNLAINSSSLAFSGAVERINPAGDVVVRDVTVHPESVEMYVDETSRFRAEVELSNPEEADEEDEEVYWSSNNQEVATINQDGVVTGVSEGEVTITAISMVNREASGSAEVQVREAGRTGTLRPGEFTHFEGGLIIGTEPGALEEPIEVEIEWFEPDEQAPYADDRLAQSGPFVQITAKETKENMVYALENAGFFVALPFSEEFDSSLLTPFGYSYSEYSPHFHEDHWIDLPQSVTDPEHRHMVVPIYAIGSREHPTRLGIVEHQERETETIGPALEWVEEHFDTSQRENGSRDIDSLDQEQSLPGPMEITENFHVDCQIESESCDDSAVETMLEEIGSTLEVAKERFKDLDGSPTPRLSEGWFGKNRGKYKYYVRDKEKLWPCRSAPGAYDPVFKTAVTCLSTVSDLSDPDYDFAVQTSNHELFHTIQFDYAKIPRGWIIEGTAALNEDIDIAITVGSSDPSDQPALERGIHYESGPFGGGYEMQHFWYWLLKQIPNVYSDIDRQVLQGRLFEEGLTTGAARRFIQDNTNFGSISEAHWHWAQDAAFVGAEEIQNTNGYNVYGHDCEVNFDAFDNTYEDNGSEHLERYHIPSSSGSYDFDFEIANKGAVMYEMVFEPLDYPHYYEVSVDTDSDRIYIYTDDTQYNPISNNCVRTNDSEIAFHPDVDDDFFPPGGSVGEIYNLAGSDSRPAYLLMSNDAKLLDRDYEVTVDGPHRLYELTVMSQQHGEVVNPDMESTVYKKEEEVTIEAQPDEDFVFQEWTGDIDNVEDPYSASTTVTMEDDYEITATYAPRKDLTVGICGAGTVEVTPVDVDDKYLAERPNETFGYAEGDTVLLEAIPNDMPDPEWNPVPGQDPAEHPKFVTWEAEDPDEFFDDEVDDPDAELHPNPELELPMIEARMGDDGQTREIRALFTGGETHCVPPPETDITITIGEPDPIDINFGINTGGVIDFDWNYPITDTGESDFDFYLEIRVHQGNGEAGEIVYATLTEETSHSIEAAEFEPGQEYLWQVKAVHQSGLQSAFTQPLFFGVSPDNEIDISIGFDDPTSRDSYQLVGLPGQLDVDLSETVGGDPETGWRAFRETGAETTEEALEEYDRSDAFNFRPGRGFWLLAQEGWSFEGEIPSIETREENPVIDIQPGWNIISNPLTRDIEWNEIQAANHMEAPLWQWEGNWQQAHTFLSAAQRGQAYYFYNENRDREKIILETENDDEHRKSVSEIQDQTQLSAPFSLDAFIRDERAAGISIGLTDDEEQTLYQHAPPAHFEKVSLRITDTEDDSPNSDYEYARAIVPEYGGSGQKFNLILRGEQNMAVTLTATGIDEFTESEVYLVESERNRVHNLRENPEINVSVNNANGEVPMKLLVGDETFVEDSYTPEEFKLRPPYPNPFNSAVSVEYDLADESNVRITAYNALGRQVAVIDEGSRSAGTYVVRWEPANLATGTYFIRLEAGGQTYIQQVSHVK